MTKQEKIQEAYGEYKGHIDENGWTNFIAIGFFGEKNLDSKVSKSQSLIYRPKSLQGIENNNGWIKIESKEDLPKEDCRLHVFPKYLECDMFNYYNDEGSRKALMEYHTHYQLIIKPEPPIY